MSLVVIDLLLVLSAALAGAVPTWWLARRDRGRTNDRDNNNDKTREATDVLTNLRELAAGVGIDLDQHNCQLEEINDKLTAVENHEAKDVFEAVARLVQINEHMQSRLESAEDRLREQAQQIESHATEARTDALTLLANRRAFDDEMARRFAEFQRQGTTFSLMMVDVDHFKKFNDTHGHQAGDEVLRNVARALRRKMRAMDLVARYGGEEFAVIFPGTSIEDANQAAKRARKAIEKTNCVFDEKVLGVTASFGVAQLASDPDTSVLIKRADEALYASKEAGRNCGHWHDGEASHPVAGNREAGHDRLQVEQQQEQACEQTQTEPTQPPLGSKVEGASKTGPAADGVEERAVAPSASSTETIPELLDRTGFCHEARRRVAEWKRGGTTFSVVLLEIDQYEQIARQGDQYAVELAWAAASKLTLSAVREMDLVARYNPDTFALLFPGAGLAGVIRVAERLRQVITEYALPVGGEDLQLTFSVGVAEVAERDDVIELLRRAEAALDAGRQRGGNCTYHHDGEQCAPISALLETVKYLA